MAGQYSPASPLLLNLSDPLLSSPLSLNLGDSPGQVDPIPVPFGTGLSRVVSSGWGRAGRLGLGVRGGWSDLDVRAKWVGAKWLSVAVTGAVLQSSWSSVSCLACAQVVQWQAGVSLAGLAASEWTVTDSLGQGAAVHWQGASSVTVMSGAVWSGLDVVADQRAVAWSDCGAVDVAHDLAWQSPEVRQFEHSVRWGGREYSAGCHNNYQAGLPVVLSLSSGGPGLDLSNAGNPVVCKTPEPSGGRDPYRYVPPVDPVGQIVIPTLRTYILIHDISVTRLGDSVLIAASQIQISLDADSWAWGWSATLLGRDALDAVQPDGDGEPVTLVAAINGYEWHLVVEDWSESRRGVERSVRVSGRGTTARLAATWQLSSSGLSTVDRTLKQLINDHLPVDGSWSVSWGQGVPDYLVPAGAWGWTDKAPIAAVADAAAQVGLVVVPDRTGQGITVQHRYPVLPWHYDQSSPDLVVPDAVMTSLSRQPATPQRANAVYVQGQAPGGVLARVLRSGSAGDRLAASHTSSLITDVAAARSVGSRILAAQSQQPEVRSVSYSLGGSLVLGQIGQLLRAEVDGVNHHGVVNSVSITASLSASDVDVTQTLTIGEQTTNQYARFRQLLSMAPVIVAAVISDNGDGSVVVRLAGGQRQRVRGSGSVGQSVYIRDGVVEGAAPSLSLTELKV